MTTILHDRVSPLIESQFPAFYREEGPLFVQFVKEYYKWLESTGNPLYHSRHLLQYNDVDKTLDEFLPHIQQKFLAGTQTNSVQNQRELIKHSRDIYQTKGTIESLRLIFQMLFGAEIDVHYPGDDILRASDGVWVMPRYLELSISNRTHTFIGKVIRGSISGATAFVESVHRRVYRGRTVDVAQLSAVRANEETGQGFLYGELVSDDAIVADAPKVVGSLTRVGVTSAGAGFEEGQLVDIVSDRKGIEGKARVTSIGNRTGEVNYLLVDGGYGYSMTPSIIVSANVLSLTSYRAANAAITAFPEFSTIIQPLANVSFNTSNTTFHIGDLVYGVNSTSGVVASGFVLNEFHVGTSGWALVSPHNIATLTLSSVQFPDVTTGSFVLGDTVYQTNVTGNAAVGVIVAANSTTAVIDRYIGPFTSNVTVHSTVGPMANVAAASEITYNSTNFNDPSIARIIVAGTNTGAVVSSVVNLTAQANVVGAVANSVGIYQNVNNFRQGSKAWIFNANDYATAEVTAINVGNPGYFKIGSLSNTETVFLCTDVLSGSNSANSPYLGMTINAASYGLPANTAAGYTSVIGTTFTKQPITIGTIQTLTERFPGYLNTSAPFVVEIEKRIAAFDKRNINHIKLANNIGQFRAGESVTQSIAYPTATLNITSANGSFSYGTRELVKQVRSDGVTVYGELRVTSIIGANGSLTIAVANTSNTFNNSNTVIGLTSGATASVANVVIGTANNTARGSVLDSSTEYVTVRRTSFEDFISGGYPLYGSETGATATIVLVESVPTANVLGNDAHVNPLAGISDGTIANIEVVDSGVFYENGETVTITANGLQTPAFGVAYVETTGVAAGYWKGHRGTLDSTNRIQDNEYYQEYSYEIRSGIERNLYEYAVNNLTHVAGTKMFSRYVDSTYSSTIAKKASVSYNTVTTITFNVDPTHDYVRSELVRQYNGLTVVAEGEVLSFDTTLNKLEIVNQTAQFTKTYNVVGVTSGAVGTPSNLKIELL